MKKIAVLIILLLTIGCSQQREVQLPHTTLNDITEVQDVSPVYLFYDEVNDSVIFNRKNMISTTNWLVNIDKRLSLKQILPHLQYLQNKRNKAGMHKNENAKNYFTCFNPETKGLSFIDFTQTKYAFNLEQMDSLLSNKPLINENTMISIYFRPDRAVLISSNSYEATKISTRENYLNDLDSILNLNKFQKEIFIENGINVSYEDYISFKSDLLKLRSENIKVSNIEYIFN